MKTTIVLISTLVSLAAKGQSIDTARATLALRWIEVQYVVAHFPSGDDDSTVSSPIRAIRNKVLSVNPTTDNTIVTFNNVPGPLIMFTYDVWMKAPAGEIVNLGTTNPERFNIYTTIRAISNAAVQQEIAVHDALALASTNRAILKGYIRVKQNTTPTF